MTSKKVFIAPTTLVGIQEIGPSSFNQQMDGSDFGAALWKKLFSMLGEINLPLSEKMYGVSWPADNLTPPDVIHFFVGFEKKDRELPGTFISLNLEGGNYFAYQYSGPISAIDDAYQKAYLEALPQSGFSGREGQHLELYEAEVDLNSPEITFTILIPVQ